MINTKQVDITPARRESQMIRPSSNLMSGKSPNTSTQWASPNVISPDSNVYNRVNKVKQDRLDRSRELEDAERIRGQVLEDNAVKRNQQIEDLDRKRIETISDTELDYERGREGREFTRRKNKEYFKTLERDRAKQNKDNKQLKDQMLINAKIAYAKVLDQEKQGATSDELREGLEQQRQDLAKQRESNKKTFIVNVMSSVGMTMEGDDDESIDKINSIVASEFPGKVWEDLVTYEHKFRVANKLASMAGDGAIRVSGIENMINNQSAQTAEIQKSLNESIESYDSMLLEIRSKSISSNSVSGLKDMYKNRIIELGGNIDQFMAEGEGDTEGASGETNEGEESNKPSMFDKEDKQIDDFLGVPSTYEEYLAGLEEGKTPMSEDEWIDTMAEKGEKLVEDRKDDLSDANANDRNPSIIYGLSNGLGATAEALSNIEVDGGDAVTAAAVVAPTAFAWKGHTDATKRRNEINETRKQRALTRIQNKVKTDGYFKTQGEVNGFLKKHGFKEFTKPHPVQPGAAGQGPPAPSKGTPQSWDDDFSKHIDAELNAKKKTFMQSVTKKLKSKGVRRAGGALLVYEAIVLGGEALKGMGVIDKDPEVIEAAKRLKEAEDAVKSFKQHLKKQSEEILKIIEEEESNSTASNPMAMDDNSTDPGPSLIKPMPEANATAPMPEANATAPMPEANATAPSASVIKPEQPTAPTSMPSRDNVSDQPQPDIVTSQMSAMLGQQFDSSKIRINDFKSNGRDFGFGYLDESGSFYYTGMVSPDGKIISLKRIPIDEYGRPGDQHEKLL